MTSQLVLGKVLKALYAAVIAALSGLLSALGNQTTFTHITATQWLTVALAAVLAFGGVFGLASWSGPGPAKP
jgi:hypothetical protein